MGELVFLAPRRLTSARPVLGARPAFFFDVGCPLSYLAAEHIERIFGDVDWVPVSGAALHGERSDAELAHLRHQAEEQAAELRLPLVWPERFPAGAWRTQRAAAFAAELGAGPRFAVAAGRLAFCGGFDLDDPETRAEAAAAAAVPLGACLEAAADPSRDLALTATALALRARAVRELPVLRSGERWFAGGRGWRVAATVLRPAPTDRFASAPPAGGQAGPEASITALGASRRAAIDSLAPAS
jgi:2-hydroxychromene-2-carboxylate isomerase